MEIIQIPEKQERAAHEVAPDLCEMEALALVPEREAAEKHSQG